MPVIFRHKGFRFFFYSNEGNPRERMHIHVRDQGGEAKFWVKPEVGLSSSDGLNARTLRELEQTVVEHATLIEETWNDYFRA